MNVDPKPASRSLGAKGGDAWSEGPAGDAARAGFVLENSYAEELGGTYVATELEGYPAAELVAWNRPLAEALGLDSDAPSELLADVVAGNVVPEGATPIALAYAGHQFGHLSPLLGDGRAALLGELIDPNGRRWDVQLKGSGPTAFSRGGDGRATLGPILRELLVSEAMHHLGVPTTRVLAAIETGQGVRRQTLLPGAALARVASSHLRVGTFELFARRGDEEKLRQLTEYALRRHFPASCEAPNAALALLDRVADVQSELIAKWMLVGFVHGVMNTDNFTISGETIDYGPCAFMDAYDPRTVFSSIDHGGRYAYRNQPGIGAWNLARLAEALLPMIDPEPERGVELANERIAAFQRDYEARFRAGLRRKLGWSGAQPDDDALATEILEWMHANGEDFTGFFRRLAASLRGADAGPAPEEPPVLRRWRERALGEAGSASAVADGMDAINPLYIPRNHKVEEALSAAHDGDMAPFETLLGLVREPFVAHDVAPDYTRPADAGHGPYRTFCGT